MINVYCTCLADVLEILERGLGKPSLRNLKNSGSGGVIENNNTKVINDGSTASVNPVTTAILNGTAGEFTVIKQEPVAEAMPTVNVNANVNVIELKPGMMRLDPTKVEQDFKELNNITLNSDDLSVLDNSLTLDPALSDLALQVTGLDYMT